MTVINCTQHLTTEDQRKDNIVDLPEEFRCHIQQLLTFETLPSRKTLGNRAELIVNELLAYSSQWENRQDLYGKYVMIGGAPFFMSYLHNALVEVGAVPVYAFSQRKSVDEVVDGTVVKRSVFCYEGLV
jgi:hypothetical protein